MRNSYNILSPEMHHIKALVSLSFVKDYKLISKVKTAIDKSLPDHRQEMHCHCSSKTTEIYTHVLNTSLARIKNPLDNLLNGKGMNINDLK